MTNPTPRTAAIYVVQRDAHDAAYVAHAIEALRPLANRLVLVAEPEAVAALRAGVGAGHDVLLFEDAPSSRSEERRAGKERTSRKATYH